MSLITDLPFASTAILYSDRSLNHRDLGHDTFRPKVKPGKASEDPT